MQKQKKKEKENKKKQPSRVSSVDMLSSKVRRVYGVNYIYKLELARS